MRLSPRIDKIARWAKTAVGRSPSFTSSERYWEDRYHRGGNSGSGTYGRLAAFKAATLNEFIAANDIRSVIEFGSGDGALLGLTNYPHYTGVDVSSSILEATRAKFADDSSKRFIHTDNLTDEHTADLALSLDVIYHLVEDEVFETYMQRLFSAAIRFVIIYSSDVDKGSHSPHVRQRQFTKWVKANRSDFTMSRKIPNPYPYSEKEPEETTWSDFYIYQRIETQGG